MNPHLKASLAVLSIITAVILFWMFPHYLIPAFLTLAVVLPAVGFLIWVYIRVYEETVYKRELPQKMQRERERLEKMRAAK